MEIRFRPRKSLWFLTCQSCLGDYETNAVNIHGELILVVAGEDSPKSCGGLSRPTSAYEFIR